MNNLKGKILKNKFSEIYDRKNNSFTILSVVLSIGVIYFHCYPLFYGTNTTHWDLFTSNILKGSSLGAFCVNIFFIISGFMITTSIQRSKNTIMYLIKRIKKIFPALILCLLISALIIGPLTTELPKVYYLKTFDIWKYYIIDNILLFKNTIYGIADVFVNNPYISAINGSIWTLKHQFFCYLIIILFYKVKLLDKRRIFLIAYLFMLFVYVSLYFNGMSDIEVYLQQKLSYFGVFNEMTELIRLLFYFMTGILANLYSDKIYINWFWNSVYFVIYLIALYFNKLGLAFIILLPYFTLAIGSMRSKIKFRDISYEMFVFAFPIQQLIMYYFKNQINMPVYIVLSIVLTIMISYLISIFINICFMIWDNVKRRFNV